MPEFKTDREKYLMPLLDYTLPIGLYISDLHGIVEANPLVEEIWGGPLFRTLDEFDRYKAWTLSGEPVTSEDWALARAVRKGETVIGDVLEIERFDGKRATIANSAAPVKNEKGEVIGAVAVEQDVTYQRELEKEITELRLQKELVYMERLRLVGQMVGTISHEVRNPLTSIKGFLQLFSTKEKYKDDKEYFDLIISEIDRATNILSEFLYLAQDKPVIKKESDLNSIIKSIAPLITAEAIKADVDFGMALGEIPLLEVDEQEIRQLVLNLTRNAIEATAPGRSVELKTYVQNDEVLLTICDQGCGIPDNVRVHIGEPFVTSKDTGAGLGLSVCYSIVKRHNAKIDFETSKQGTTFHIRFLTTQVSPEGVSPPKEVSLEEVPIEICQG